MDERPDNQPNGGEDVDTSQCTPVHEGARVPAASTPAANDESARSPTIPAEVLETVPGGYRLDATGVYRQGKDGEPQRIAAPVWVAALSRNGEGGDWGRLIRWYDHDGRLRERAFPDKRLHETGTPLVQELANEGLSVDIRQARELARYLGLFAPQKRLQAVKRLGWIEGTGKPAFVFPHGAIGDTDGEVIFQPEHYSPAVQSMQESGQLKHWQYNVAGHCQGNPYLVFALCAAFAGPLLKAAGMDSCGFHLYGHSSRGKTTALQVAASVWGCGADASNPQHSHIRPWNATGNAMEGLASGHNDSLLPLDEMGTYGGRDFGRMVYNLFGGQGKARMSKEAALKPPATWRIVALSTGEVSVRETIEQDGKAAKAGQLNRFMDIPINDSVIVSTHGKPDAATLANDLKNQCARFYGIAGPAFIDRLAYLEADWQSLQQRIRHNWETWTDRLTLKAPISPAHGRSLRRLALALVAGLYAAEQFEILPIKSGEVVDAIKAIRDAWLGDITNAPEAVRGVLHVRDFIQRVQHDRLVPLDRAEDEAFRVRDMAGYMDKQHGLALLTDEGFKEACNGAAAPEVARELLNRGLLHVNDGERLKSRHSVPGGGRQRFHAIKLSILEYELTPRAGGGSNEKA